jgi:alpha-galactosidase
MTRTLRIVALAVLVVAAGWRLLAREPERLVTLDDAFVDGDSASGRWTVGTGRIELSLTVTRAGDVRLDGLRWPGGPNMARLADSDALVAADGRSGPLGSGASGFKASAVDTTSGDGFVEALVRFQQERGALTATRHYRVRPATAAIEVWTELTATSGESGAAENLNAFAVTVPEGAVHWVSGLATGDPFTRHSRELVPGESLTIGSRVVSSDENVPWVAVAGGDGTFFATLGWSGSWSAFMERREEGLAVQMWLPDMSVRVDRETPAEGPHAWIGVVPGDAGQASAATQQALSAGHAPFPSLTTFNSWFVYGTSIDDGNMRDAIDQASRLGVELFQLDAGWYPQRAPVSIWDFTDGLGSWQVDRERFPEGLGAIGDHARANGMRFGVWVEPERVALAMVGRPGLAEERFLATSGGRYLPGGDSSSADAQICLGDAAAREWLLARLTLFIEDARPDYLKWDFNRWMICDRPDHGHTADGGNYAHVRGLYALIDTLRQRFPSLLIENCSGGGHRLDAGLLRLTDAGWMDDATAPAAHVRHNIEGLSSVFPASYLLSYVMPGDGEPMNGAADMSSLVRSRMMGTLGLAVNFRAVGERDLNELTQEFHLARVIRDYQSGAASYLLSPQAGSHPAWEVVQQWSPTRQRGVLWAFGNDGGRTSVRLAGLNPTDVYELRDMDSNRRQRLSGSTLLDSGFELLPRDDASAQLFTIQTVGGARLRLK